MHRDELRALFLTSVAFFFGFGPASAAAQAPPQSPSPAAIIAQRDYEIALARAAAQRDYEIAVAVAEANRKAAQGGAVPALPAPPRIDTEPAATERKTVELPRCDPARLTPSAIAADPNFYVDRCLKLGTFRSYSVQNLNTKVAFSSADGNAEVGFGHNIYFRSPNADGDELNYSQLRLRVAALIQLDEKGGTSAAFADLTEQNPFKKIGVMGGVQWRWGGAQKHTKGVESVQKMLSSAQRACMSEYAGERVTLADGTVLGRKDSPLAACQGLALQRWMATGSGRANSYYQAIAPTLWGHAPDDFRYIDLEGRWAPFSYRYYPLRDPALTGDVLLAGLPFDGNGDVMTAQRRTLTDSRFSARLKLGGVEKNFGYHGAISYRRAVNVPDDTQDVILCPPGGATGAICGKYNIARPYETQGFVLAGGLSGKIARIGLIPEIGLEMSASYALDLNQLGVDMPIYLLKDGEGDAFGGVRVGCTSDGETKAGFKIEGKCRASVFIGSKFTLGAR